jgi:hypothetical protein
VPIMFRKSIRIFPLVRLNINAHSWSLTFGGKRGPHYTWSSTGRRTTSVDLPGPLGYRRTTTSRSRSRSNSR